MELPNPLPTPFDAFAAFKSADTAFGNADTAQKNAQAEFDKAKSDLDSANAAEASSITARNGAIDVLVASLLASKMPDPTAPAA